MITNLETPDNTAPTLNDPNTVSKWCYDNSSAYCASEGGLYTWVEANALPNSCNLSSCGVSTPNQGICPAGWHIPTDAEQYTLENYLKLPGETCDPARSSDDNAWGCSDAGDKLRSGGSSGFDALGAGRHATDGSFDKREPSTNFWSSSEQLLPQVVPSYAWNRALYILGSGSEVGRSNYLKAFGYSVRCLAIDEDGDRVIDYADNCQGITNPDQADNDLDRQGDVCDTDDDNDGLLDEVDCVSTDKKVAVLRESRACQLWISGVPGKGILKAPGLKKFFVYR